MEVDFHFCSSSVMQARGGLKREFVGFRRLSYVADARSSHRPARRSSANGGEAGVGMADGERAGSGGSAGEQTPARRLVEVDLLAAEPCAANHTGER
jgi:hypothetical protein